jgi:SRSO17 transposase
VLVVDETGDEKSSTDAVGAAYQYSGALGGVGLCQVAVHLTHASRRGHAMIDRELYLPAGHAAGHSHLVIRRHRYTDELSFYCCHSATPVALATLVDVICCRWAIEEDFQLGKSACGLDQGQTTCWNSWMRWTFISMLVAAVLAVTRLRATAQTTHCRLVRSALANCSACCGPPCCPHPAATAITCCTGPPGATNTSTARPKHTAAGTTSPPPLRRDTASTITNYSCRV